MEKSPPRSYKKQQKFLNEELTKNARRRTFRIFNTNKNLTNITLEHTVDRKICKNLKIEKQHQLGFGEPN
jgi:hypothetical protein